MPAAEVRPQKATVLEVAGKLRQVNEAVPDYRLAVLQFLQFASASVSSGVPPPNTPPNLFHGGSVPRSFFDHQVVVLDGGDFSQSRFTNSRIIFTQNPVRLDNTVFIDCVFELPITSTPSPYPKRVTRRLLSSNLQTVQMPSA